MEAGLHNKDGSWITGSPTWQLGSLHGYQIAILIAIIVGFLNVYYFWKKHKYETWRLQVIMIFALPFGLLFARIYSLISERDLSEWKHFFNFAGLSIFGTVLGGLLVVGFFCFIWRDKINLRQVFGFLAPSLLLAQAIGRWGNFDNHELYGPITSKESLNWLPAIIRDNMFIDGHYRHPLFLYESIGTFIGYVALVWVLEDRNYVKPGTNFGLYLTYYGTLRSGLEQIRETKPLVTLENNIIPFNFIVTLVLIISGLITAICWGLNVSWIIKRRDKKDLVIIPQKNYEKTSYFKIVKRYFFGTPYKKEIKIYKFINWPPPHKFVVKISMAFKNWIKGQQKDKNKNSEDKKNGGKDESKEK